jgi:hypothetical protein
MCIMLAIIDEKGFRMPTLTIRPSSEVPQPSRVSRTVREQQLLYEGFIKGIGPNVGEVELADGEQIRAIKVRLRRASTRLDVPIDIWEANGRVYFTAQQAKRRGRPRKQPN